MARTRSAVSLPALTPADAIEAGGDEKAPAMDWLNALIDQAEAGDRNALKLAVQVHYALPSLWPPTNVLHSNVERSVLDTLMGTDRQLFARATIEHQLEALRTALLADTSSGLERLLVDRVVLCWLQCHHADLVVAQRAGPTCPLVQAEFYHRQAERAERRLLRAAKTLATVRRLCSPAVQINVAEEIKQVNFTG